MNDDDPFGSYGLCQVHLEHKPLFDSYLATCQTRLSDYSFANTFIWRDAINLRWRVFHDCLCVFATGDDGPTLLLPPMGNGDLATAAREALELCDDWYADNARPSLARIDYVSADALARLGSAVSAQPMSGDYVYQTQRLIDLDGSELSSKRQARNRFARRYAARTEAFGPQHLQTCIDLLETWRHQSEEGVAGDGPTCQKRLKEACATVEAMRYSRQLGLEGMVLYADEQLVGFTLGERMGQDMCSILIEKTDRQYVGSAQYIFSEFCRQHWGQTTWTNAGDDWEIPSLAWTKQSYRPAMRLDKYMVRPLRPCTVSAGSIGTDSMEVQPQQAPPEPARQCDASQPAETFDCNEAGLTDLDRLYAIEMACFAKPVAISKRQLRYLLRSPHASVHVLRSNGQIVAEALLLRRRNRGGHMTARLYSLAVDPACRGKGYGKTLLTNCINVLLAQGITDLSLEVDVENAPAIRLYESFGFGQVKRLADYYAPGKDAWKMHMHMPGGVWTAPGVGAAAHK